jgi:hypothetical protein
MYTKIKKTSSKGKVFLTLVFFAFIMGCNKDEILNISNSNNTNGKRKNTSIELKVNPCSKAIMQKALQDLGRPNDIDESRVYHYYQFNPEKVTGDMLSIIEQDKNLQILDFPFADPKLYKEDMEETWENTIRPLKDGNLYVVVNKNSPANNIFENSELGAKKLNELYLPHEYDSTLMERAYRVALDSSSKLKLFGIRLCFFKRPRGYVRYRDFGTSNTGIVRPVQGMKVFALVFGIPVNTYTDNNGYYSIPWLFNFGTFVGTHAQNHRANIKPLTTNSGWFANIGNVILNFILGSRHVEGWFGVCRIGDNDINIEFHQHNQVRLWAQLLHSVALHHSFCAQDGILPAPDNMTIYAQWDNSAGRASCPMLGHIQINPVSIMSKVFGTNLQNSAPNLFNQITGLLPDMTVKVSSAGQNDVGRMETDLHELAHASLFRRVGSIWWTEVITNIVAGGNCTGGYGCIGDIHWGKTQVNESWASYLGREHHRRIHPNANIYVRLKNNAWEWRSYTNNQALEDMVYYTTNDWLHPGIFHDIRDNYSSTEPQDNLSGYSIASMYNAFNTQTNGFCGWRHTFHSNNSVNLATLNQLMAIQNNWNQQCP